MDEVLNGIGKIVRKWMELPARVINRISGGRVSPNMVTLVSLLGHGLVVWAIWQSRPIVAAALLLVFGLMDSLDGALARIQKTSSLRGMLYDASSDRLKEALIYTALCYYLFLQGNASRAWLAPAVLGGSLVVSYIKAKGEMALSSQKNIDPQLLNRTFADGIARYEVRMFIILVGLLSGRVILALYVLLVLVAFTALQRIYRIAKVLN